MPLGTDPAPPKGNPSHRLHPPHPSFDSSWIPAVPLRLRTFSVNRSYRCEAGSREEREERISALPARWREPLPGARQLGGSSDEHCFGTRPHLCRIMTANPSALSEQFGDIDIYVFDQLLRGRITPGMTVLDAGCGAGRNVVYLLRNGYHVCAVDENPKAVDTVRRLAAMFAPGLPRDNFHVGPIEAMTFAGDSVDVVISSAVLHFASNEANFWEMLDAMWRVLRPGGMLFCRLGSTIGMEGQFRHIEGRRYKVPDGTERFLVDGRMLVDATQRLGGELLDPLTTSVVQNLRCMTTWVVRKPPP